jgi:hypothetical protein
MGRLAGEQGTIMWSPVVVKIYWNSHFVVMEACQSACE